MQRSCRYGKEFNFSVSPKCHGSLLLFGLPFPGHSMFWNAMRHTRIDTSWPFYHWGPMDTLPNSKFQISKQSKTQPSKSSSIPLTSLVIPPVLPKPPEFPKWSYRLISSTLHPGESVPTQLRTKTLNTNGVCTPS